MPALTSALGLVLGVLPLALAAPGFLARALAGAGAGGWPAPAGPAESIAPATAAREAGVLRELDGEPAARLLADGGSGSPGGGGAIGAPPQNFTAGDATTTTASSTTTTYVAQRLETTTTSNPSTPPSTAPPTIGAPLGSTSTSTTEEAGVPTSTATSGGPATLPSTSTTEEAVGTDGPSNATTTTSASTTMTYVAQRLEATTTSNPSTPPTTAPPTTGAPLGSTSTSTTEGASPPTSTRASGAAEGQCMGNDSRCRGAGKGACSRLQRQGSDCRWHDAGRCAGGGACGRATSIEACARRGCRWEGPPQGDGAGGDGAPSQCAGNDSRCRGAGFVQCDWLRRDGSDCRWSSPILPRAQVSGNFRGRMVATGPDAVAAVLQAARAAISGLTGVPRKHVAARLRGEGRRRLGAAGGQGLVVEYTIEVPSDAPAALDAPALVAAMAVTPSRLTALLQDSLDGDSGAAQVSVTVDDVSEPVAAVLLFLPGDNETNATEYASYQLENIAIPTPTTTGAAGVAGSGEGGATTTTGGAGEATTTAGDADGGATTTPGSEGEATTAAAEVALPRSGACPTVAGAAAPTLAVVSLVVAPWL